MTELNLNEPASQTKSSPLKDKLITLGIALAFMGLCVGTWMAPDLIGIDSSDLSGRGGRKLAFFLNLIWSRPAGTIAGVLGLLMVVGLFTNKDTETESDA